MRSGRFTVVFHAQLPTAWQEAIDNGVSQGPGALAPTNPAAFWQS
jgi:hypothetical protein